MPATRVMTIRTPVAGVHRRAELQSQPPFSAYDARDMWPRDAKTGRTGLAVRPGFAAYGGAHSQHNNTNLIATLNIAKGQEILFTASAGALYSHSGSTPTSVGSGVTTGRNVQWTVYLQDLFIANDGTPKVYKHQTATFGDWTATLGTVPANCRIAVTWGDRVVLAADPNAPNVWHMSRDGDAYDWQSAEDDEGSPISNAEVENGRLSDPITAVIPHNRQCIIFGTPNSMSVLRDNPTAGGRMEWIAHVVGPVNQTAWCKTPSDWTYMLTRDGLYRMPPGCGNNPEPVSKKVIPESLRTMDGVTRIAYLCYDVLFNGIYIFEVVASSGSVTDSWWFDLEYEGFWPITPPPGTGILSIHRHDPIETDDVSGVLIGARNSGLYRLDRTQPLGGSSAAYAQIGPFGLGQTLGRKSLMQKATVKLAANTDDENATLDFYGAENAEGVVALPQERTFRTTAEELLDNHGTCYPRVGGQAGLMVLTQSNTSKHLSFEEVALTVPRAGEERG